MKTRCIFLLMFFTIAVNAQDSELPSKIRDSLSKKFPAAIDLSWAGNNNKYEIEFYQGPDMYTAVYDLTGSLLEVAVIISDDRIPEKLLSEIAKKHPDAGLAYAEKVTTTNNEEFIRIVTESENMVYTVIAHTDGTIVKIDTQDYNSNNDDNQDVE